MTMCFVLVHGGIQVSRPRGTAGLLVAIGGRA
jgi:hypothetical protein